MTKVCMVCSKRTGTGDFETHGVCMEELTHWFDNVLMSECEFIYNLYLWSGSELPLEHFRRIIFDANYESEVA